MAWNNSLWWSVDYQSFIIVDSVHCVIYAMEMVQQQRWYFVKDFTIFYIFEDPILQQQKHTTLVVHRHYKVSLKLYQIIPFKTDLNVWLNRFKSVCCIYLCSFIINSNMFWITERICSIYLCCRFILINICFN